jgi:predicted anti-sigma-YlaC factor YlaD
MLATRAVEPIGARGNFSVHPLDLTDMDCERVQIAVSARRDGEESDLSDDLVDRHLRRCAACRAYAAALEASASPLAAGRGGIADLVVAEAPRADRSGAWNVLRLALLAIGAIELVLALPALLYAHAGHGDEHLARHVGAFATAFAVGLVVVALRPSRARALVPITAALAVAMVGGAIADTLRGDTPVFAESEHLLEVCGLVLVWLLATRRGWTGPGEARHPEDASPPGDGGAFRPRVVPSTDDAAQARRAG